MLLWKHANSRPTPPVGRSSRAGSVVRRAAPFAVGDAAAGDAPRPQHGVRVGDRLPRRDGLVQDLPRVDSADVGLERALQREPIRRRGRAFDHRGVAAVVAEVVGLGRHEPVGFVQRQRRPVAEAADDHGAGAWPVTAGQPERVGQGLFGHAEMQDVLFQLPEDVVAAERVRGRGAGILHQDEAERREGIPHVDAAGLPEDALVVGLLPRPLGMEAAVRVQAGEIRAQEQRLTPAVDVAEVLDPFLVLVAEGPAAFDGQDGRRATGDQPIDGGACLAQHVGLGVVREQQQGVDRPGDVGALEGLERPDRLPPRRRIEILERIGVEPIAQLPRGAAHPVEEGPRRRLVDVHHARLAPQRRRVESQLAIGAPGEEQVAEQPARQAERLEVAALLQLIEGARHVLRRQILQQPAERRAPDAEAQEDVRRVVAAVALQDVALEIAQERLVGGVVGVERAVGVQRDHACPPTAVARRCSRAR